MPKYEIMLIIDPKAELKVAQDLANDVFGQELESVVNYDRTTLAYPINKSTTALYALIIANTDGAKIKEFTRKANIIKTIWRFVVINLDAKKVDKKPRKSFKPPFRDGGEQRNYRPRPSGEASNYKPRSTDYKPSSNSNN